MRKPEQERRVVSVTPFSEDQDLVVEVPVDWIQLPDEAMAALDSGTPDNSYWERCGVVAPTAVFYAPERPSGRHDAHPDA